MICKKCNSAPGSVILRTMDYYCEPCFMVNLNHKFRACIGKNKILSRNEKVLICSSGGVASTTLLDLVHTGLGQDIHKKLRIQPIVLHVMENFEDSSKNVANMIIQQCKKYNLEVYIISVTEYNKCNSVLPTPFTVPNVQPDDTSAFNLMISSLQSSLRNDFCIKIKHNLFLRMAELLKCNYIFTAETTTTLAVNLLSNLAIGRGSQVEQDIGFCDSRDESIKCLRPMKDISNEELNYYANLKQLKFCPLNNLCGNSIQSLIHSFVSDLQTNFPATISTVCKTAEKISAQNKQKQDKCTICKSDLDPSENKFTALQATNFSQTVSNKNLASLSNHMLFDETKNGLAVQTNSKNMFPHINRLLCYTCSRTCAEIDNPSRIPKHVKFV